MNFDKINFVLNVLSSSTVLAEQQNLMKLFVVDSIGDTEIQTVEFRLQQKDGRNAATTIVEWTELTATGTFYEATYSPEFTATTSLTLGLQVKITDALGNSFLLEDSLKGVS